MSTKSKFEIRTDRFKELVDKLQDLSQISDTVKLKFDHNNLMAYSLVASDSAVLCLKAYFMSTVDHLAGFDREGMHDLVIASAPRFVKNMRFFEGMDRITGEITFKPSFEDDSVMHVRSISVSTPAKKGDRLKVNTIGAELSKIRDLSRESLLARMSPEKSLWSFVMTADDLLRVRKLSNVNSEERTITITVESGVVYLGEEGRWRIQVAETEHTDTKLTFAKRHLAHIDQDFDHIEVSLLLTVSSPWIATSLR
jgi:hypothetical protein